MSFKKLRQLFVAQGNGHLTTAEHSVSSFLRLHISLPCALELTASGEEKIVLTTDENLQSLISIVNSGRTLYISANTLKTPEFSHLKIQIHIRQLDTINLGTNAGNVIMTEPFVSNMPLDIKVQSAGNTTLLLSAPSIKLNDQSHGDLKIAGECAVFNAKTESHGHFYAKDLRAQQVNFNTQSNGNAEIRASETFVIKHAANGFVHYYGEGILKDIQHHGNGEVKHCQD